KPHQSSAAAEFDKYFKNQKPAKFGADKDLHALKKNGEKIPIEVSLNPFQLEDKQFLMFLFNDISLRKKQEEEILHLNRKLGKLVDERTTELREIIVDLKEEIFNINCKQYQFKKKKRRRNYKHQTKNWKVS